MPPLAAGSTAARDGVDQPHQTRVNAFLSTITFVAIGYLCAAALLLSFFAAEALLAVLGIDLARFHFYGPLTDTAVVLGTVALARFGILPIVYFVLVVLIKRCLLRPLVGGLDYAEQGAYRRYSNWLYGRLIDVPFFDWAIQLTNMSALTVVQYRLLGARIGRHAFFTAPYTTEPELLDIADEAMIAGNVALFPANRGVGRVATITLTRKAAVANSCILQGGVEIGRDSLLGDLSVTPPGFVLQSQAIAAGNPPRIVGRTDFESTALRGARYVMMQTVLVVSAAHFRPGCHRVELDGARAGHRVARRDRPAIGGRSPPSAPCCCCRAQHPHIGGHPACEAIARASLCSRGLSAVWLAVRALGTAGNAAGAGRGKYHQSVQRHPVCANSLRKHGRAGGRFGLLAGLAYRRGVRSEDHRRRRVSQSPEQDFAHSIKRHSLIFQPTQVEAAATVRPFAIVEAGATVHAGQVVGDAIAFHAAREASGKSPYEKHYVNLHEIEAAAASKLPQNIFEYFAGGAADEVTLDRNEDIYARLQILPRVLRDVTKVSTTRRLLDVDIPLPVMVAPMAMQQLAHADGETGMARAACLLGVPYVLSCLSTTALEDVAAAGTA